MSLTYSIQKTDMAGQVTEIHPSIRFRVTEQFALLCFMVLLALQSNVVVAVTDPTELSEIQAAFLAEKFTPLLIFHPDEQFFPSSPLFSLPESSSRLSGQSPDPENVLELLGTPEARREQYLSLTLPDKARLATVYYRVVRSPKQSDRSIVIEYWFYYVWNTYSSRPGLFPFWFDGSHPNDMEHVRVVLGPDAVGGPGSIGIQGTHFRLASMVISAHEGMAPSNRYDFSSDQDHEGKTRVMVELGSHAAGTDIDGDGIFTPGKDGESGYKILWGIRDKGLTWSRYNPAYMDTRNDDRAMLFCHGGLDSYGDGGGQDACPRGSFTYRLLHVDELHEQFDQLDLSHQEYEQAFETKVGWLKRMFGKSNGDYEKLVLPPTSDPDRKTKADDNFSATERGVKLGITTLIWNPGVFLGGRYSFLHGSKFPDLMLEAEGVLTTEGKFYFSTAVLASYPIDAITKVFGGVGLVTEPAESGEPQWDLIGGLEFRVGGVRVSATGRTMGPITESALDFRLYYFF